MKKIKFEHYRGNEEFVKRMYDRIDQMQRQHKTIITPFFSPDQASLVKRICGEQILYREEGGYAGAERVRFGLYPDHIDMDNRDVPIQILEATYSSNFGKLAHRDVLGALMNVGVEREMFGDLVVSDTQIHIICNPDIEHYITCNLTRIKQYSVHFIRNNHAIMHTPNIYYEQKIVSSLRLDALVSLLSHISRKKAQALIHGKFVKVNHVVLEQTSHLCNNNNAISIRGYGRFLLQEVVGKTKKDHLIIRVGRYE